MPHTKLNGDIERIADAHRMIQEMVDRHVVGNRELVDLIMIGVLTDGHILIDGVPGTAKTTISKIMARLLGYRFSRVQGAFDVQPADIIGVRIFDAEKHQFVLQPGPIFANFVMVDEMNRLTPKTQSAFIEAMAEHQATIDGITYSLGDPYFVVATQNAQEFEGTFPLIEAQRDRFNYSITLHHLDRENEIEILRRDRDGTLDWNLNEGQLRPILSAEQVKVMSETARRIYVDDSVLQYIRDIVMASRSHDDVRLGLSTRGSLALHRGAKARAALEGRTYVIPDDVEHMAPFVMNHRLILDRGSEMGWIGVDNVISEILESVEVT